MKVLTFKQFLVEKELPPTGSLMRRIWNMFDRYGAIIQGKNKIVYNQDDIDNFVTLVKEYIKNKLNLKAYKDNAFEDPASHERFTLNVGPNQVELVFN